MEVLNYTPLSRERLDILYQKKKKHPLMDLFLIILAVLTVAVLCVVLVMLYKRNIQPPLAPAKAKPSSTPTPTEVPTDTPIPDTPTPTNSPTPIASQSATLFNSSSSGTLSPTQ